MNITLGDGARSYVALDGTIQILGRKADGEPRAEVGRISFASLSDCLELLQQVSWCADFINQEAGK